MSDGAAAGGGVSWRKRSNVAKSFQESGLGLSQGRQSVSFQTPPRANSAGNEIALTRNRFVSKWTLGKTPALLLCRKHNGQIR